MGWGLTVHVVEDVGGRLGLHGLEGLHLLDSAFLYPEDRSQSGLIRKALERSDDITS